MAETYGELAGQTLEDPPWLADCGHRGWVALTKDADILRKQPGGSLSPQLAAITSGLVRVFLLMNQQLAGADQVARYVKHQDKIISIALARPGPYVYGLYDDRMREVWRPRRPSSG
jgi:hypothetical protein